MYVHGFSGYFVMMADVVREKHHPADLFDNLRNA